MKTTIKMQNADFLDSNDVNTDVKIEKCLHAFHHFYELKKYPEAFEQLWLAIGLFEESDNTNLKIDLLKCAVMCAPFFMLANDTKPILEAIIAHESIKEQPEILSLCYFLLSVFSLQLHSTKSAVDYSIMSYYYARKCHDELRYYECNAQLQLVTSLIEDCDVHNAKQYIEKFEWYLENCRNTQELVFVSSIEATMELLQGSKEKAFTQIEVLLQKFIQSEEIMYTSYLALHFKRVLLKYSSLHENDSLLLLCEAVVNRVLYFTSELNELTHARFTTHTQMFYTRSIELVAKYFEQNQQTALHKFTLFDDDFSITQLMTLFEQKNIAFYIHTYAPNRYTLISCSLGHQLLLKLYGQKKLLSMGNFCKYILNKQQFYKVFYNEINLKVLTDSFSQHLEEVN